ncbi:MAG: hypothetical protein KGS45_07825 [Planctomycetes bacterium]|nr:hypothetical protein [Planctomycetota bacterium]
MFGKVAIVVIGLGAASASLLALRQQRLQAAHELAKAQLRIERQDEELWKVRAKIAGLVNPQSVEMMASEVAELHALVPDAPDASVPPPVQGGVVSVSLTPPPPKRYIPPAKKDKRTTTTPTNSTTAKKPDAKKPDAKKADEKKQSNGASTASGSSGR